MRATRFAGVIEGFFGKSWDAEARFSMIDFLSDNAYQFYIYAPKNDPFLRRRWREALPSESLQGLSELKARSAQRGITFGIGLTPFEIYLNYDADARSALRAKVLQLNETGADMLCILFDDMRGDFAELPELQGRIIADISGWSDAQRFVVCPTYYSYDPILAREFGAPAQTYLRDLARAIDPRIDIFWTGEKVISNNYPAAHLSEVANELGRKPFIWDNHIANDAKLRTNRLFLDPSFGGWSLPADAVAGLAINPMNQPYLSQIALRGYSQLLESGAESPPTFAEVCGTLADADFSQWLRDDLENLQNKGLSAMDDQTRQAMLQRYSAQESNPYAREITAWLRGEYAFDPQCLTT